MPMQITAHAIGIAMRFALSGAEWAEAELSCLRAFLGGCFLGGFFFKSEKKMCRSPPPPPSFEFAALFFSFFFFWAFVPFLGWPWGLFAEPKCPSKSKVPFLKMALPFQILKSSPDTVVLSLPLALNAVPVTWVAMKINWAVQWSEFWAGMRFLDFKLSCIASRRANISWAIRSSSSYNSEWATTLRLLKGKLVATSAAHPPPLPNKTYHKSPLQLCARPET